MRKITRREAIIAGLAAAAAVVGGIEVVLATETGGKTKSTSGTTVLPGPPTASAGGFSSPSASATQANFSTSSADYQFFVQPYLSNIEALRSWLMSPFDAVSQKAGYDPDYGMIRGGYWGGGFQNGFVLIDTQLLLAKTLDFQNAQKRVSTNIEGKVRSWLSGTFVDPNTGATQSYNGEDRREILFGNGSPACVYGTSGQVFYAQGHTLSDPVPITTALPTTCTPLDGPGPMNTFAIQVMLEYLKGNGSVAQEMFSETVAGWTPTENTGVGGTTGGYFSGNFDKGTCNSTRVLGYWTCMARATGYWTLNDAAKTMAQQVLNEMWAHQLSSGGILVNYPLCGGGGKSKDSGESAGITMLSADPRIPGWFGR